MSEQDSFSFPKAHLCAPKLTRAPKGSAELFDLFEAWLTLGGEDGRAGIMGRASIYLSRGFPKDLAVLLQVQSQTAALMSWLNAQIPEANAFYSHAMALYTMEALTEEKLKTLKDADRKLIVVSRVATYARVAKLLDRLSATATHRLESLRTQIATERALWEGGQHGGA